MFTYLRKNVLVSSVLLAISSSYAFAGGPGVMQKNCNNSVYFLGGYVYGYSFLEGGRQNDTPDSFNGVKLGIGEKIRPNVDFQLSYSQFPQVTRNSTASTGEAISAKSKEKSVDVDMHYIFNPGQQFEYFAKAGVNIAQVNYLVTANDVGILADTETRVNPTVGAGGEYKVTSELSLSGSLKYVISVNSDDSIGHLGVFLGATYHPAALMG